MYSIYDYYGMKNDLDNRYTAGKQQGTTSAEKNNTPFLSMLTEPAPTSTIANAGTSELPSGPMSLYGDRAEDTETPYNDQQIAEAWAKYEGSPQQAQDIAALKAMGGAALDVGGLISGFMGGGKAVGTAIGLGKSIYDSPLVTGKNDWNTTGKNFLSTLFGAVVPNVGGKYGSKLGGSNQILSILGGILGNEAQKGIQRGLIEQVVDWATGKYSPDKPTIGNPVTDPFLAVGPDTEAYNGTNMLGDPTNDPFGAVGPYGGSDFGGGDSWGGGPNDVPSDWSGYDWGDY